MELTSPKLQTVSQRVDGCEEEISRLEIEIKSNMQALKKVYNMQPQLLGEVKHMNVVNST